MTPWVNAEAPLHEGVKSSARSQGAPIVFVVGDGVAVCEPGVRLGALENEARCQAVNFASDDTNEALAAFVEKRDPIFIGR